MSGIIYILSHESMPNLLKIGYTGRSIEERVRELSSTGVPGKFTVELYFKTENAPLFEMMLHKSMHEYRHEKEFFRVDIKTVIHSVHSLIEDSKINSYQFYGKCSAIATTKEQIQYQKNIFDNKQRKAEQRANELRQKYLNKTYDELRVIQRCSNDNDFDEVTKIMGFQRQYLLESYPKKTNEALVKLLFDFYHETKWSDYECKLIRGIFDVRPNGKEFLKKYVENLYKDTYTNLIQRINDIVNHISPNRNTLVKKLAFSILGYSLSDGKTISQSLSHEQKKIVVDFEKINREINHFIYNPFLKDVSFLKSNSLLIEKNKKLDCWIFSKYFEGILAGCSESLSENQIATPRNSQVFLYEWELTAWGLENINTKITIPISFIQISREQGGIFIDYKEQKDFIPADKIKNFDSAKD